MIGEYYVEKCDHELLDVWSGDREEYLRNVSYPTV
jgi:hypothetical protein